MPESSGGDPAEDEDTYEFAGIERIGARLGIIGAVQPLR